MKFHYDKETDSLYIHLTDAPSVDSNEVQDGVVLDYDQDGNLVGIDIEYASSKVDMTSLVLEHLPIGTLRAA